MNNICVNCKYFLNCKKANEYIEKCEKFIKNYRNRGE